MEARDFSRVRLHNRHVLYKKQLDDFKLLEEQGKVFVIRPSVPIEIGRIEEIKEITGFDIDHSFLSYKKELLAYGYKAEKISMKKRCVEFIKLD